MRLVLWLLFLVPASLPAQLVRDVVRDSASHEPAVGVLVALVERASGARRVVLTDESGRFLIAAPGAGSYALETKRIGVRPALTDAFVLGIGETRELSLTVAPVVAQLAAVRVSGKSYCAEQVNEGAETATLWEEVRAALTAARLTRERRGFPATIASFRRTLDPASSQIRSEERSEQHGITWNPFPSVSPSSLSAHGYIVDDGAGSLVYIGPDVDVLLSDAFVRDHCFRRIPGRDANVGLVGLAFEPTSARRVPDIAGVLWLDAETRELRRLEYSYTRQPIDVGSLRLTSAMEYARLPSGAWIVRRWMIRMPQFASARVHEGPRNPLVFTEPERPRLVAIVEEGGEAHVGPQPTIHVARLIEGSVYDSTAGTPLVGARVSLRGTSYGGTTDAAGRFRIELPDSGTYMLAFEHPRLDTLGFDAPAREVHVADVLSNASLAVPPLAVVRAALCPGARAPTGVLHGTVRTPAGAPAAWATLRYQWSRYTVTPAGAQSPLPSGATVPVAESAPGATLVVDSRGRYLICDVPPGHYRLTFESDTGEVAESDAVVGEGQFVLREMRLRKKG